MAVHVGYTITERVWSDDTGIGIIKMATAMRTTDGRSQKVREPVEIKYVKLLIFDAAGSKSSSTERNSYRYFQKV